MEIGRVSNNAPPAGPRPATESAPVFPSGQKQGQITVEAVRQPAGVEKTAVDKAVTDPRQVEEAIAIMAKSLNSLYRSSHLQLSVDDELGRVVVKVLDVESQEVIKQFPSEEALTLAKSLQANGSFHREKA